MKLHSGTSQKTMLKFKPISRQNRIDEHQQLYNSMSKSMHQPKLHGSVLRTCHKSSKQSIGRDQTLLVSIFPTHVQIPSTIYKIIGQQITKHPSTSHKVPQIICTWASIPSTSIKRSHSRNEIPFWQGKLETCNLYGMHPVVSYLWRYNLGQSYNK
jgi:hypothetical protein